MTQALPAPAAVTGHSAWPWVNLAATAPPPAPPPGGRWPRISIVTPNYNYGHLIERTMRSVLSQGYPDLEYVVVDDGSTDHSVDVIRRYGDRLAHWTHRPNRGQYESVNEGFARATGEVCAWLDSDDIYLPWTLWCVGAIFAAFPEVRWLVGTPAVFQGGAPHHVRPLRPFPRDMIRAGLFHGGPGGLGWISQENLFWRRELWDAAGPLRTELRVGADYDMNVRFAAHADLYVTTTMLGGFTVRPGQNRSTVERPQYLADIRRVLGEIRARGDALPAAEWYAKGRRVPIVRGLAARLARLGSRRGPVLSWDDDRGGYVVRHEPFLPPEGA